MTKSLPTRSIARPLLRATLGLVGCALLLGACAAERLATRSSDGAARSDPTDLSADAGTVAAAPLEDVPMPSEAIPSGPDAEYTADGLVRVPLPRTRNARLYVKPPRPHLQRYERAVLAPTEIGYHQSTAAMSRRDESGMRTSFERDLVDVLESGEFWEIAEALDESTLILRATVADLQMDTVGSGLGGTSATSFVNASGGAILGFEIFDGTSGEPLMRYIERHRLPAGVYSGSDIDGQRIRMVFRDFAKSLGSMLSLQYRYIREIERKEKATGGG